MKRGRTSASHVLATPNLRTAVLCALAGTAFMTEIVTTEQLWYVMELFWSESASIVCCGFPSFARRVTDAMEERWR